MHAPYPLWDLLGRFQLLILSITAVREFLTVPSSLWHSCRKHSPAWESPGWPTVSMPPEAREWGGQCCFLLHSQWDFFQGEKGFWCCVSILLGFPGGSDGEESTCNAGDLGSIPGLGRSPGGGHGNPLQYFFLENPMERGAWWATVHGVAKSWTRLSD